MKTLILLLSFSTLLLTGEQKVEVMKWPALKQELHKDNGKIKIINFWATWCKPCIEELPDFEKIHNEYKDVEVILVSLDQASLANTKVKTSLEKHKITARVIVLDEVDFNKWINDVDPSWSGAIPATLIVEPKSKLKQFQEKQFTYSELKQTIETLKQ